MPVNKQVLKQNLAVSAKELAKDTPDVKAELAVTLSETETLVEGCLNEYAVPFIFWNDFFNTSGILSPKSGKQQYRYKWGDKVFLDFGCSNIQTELSFPHPAVVMYNFPSFVIVVPTTSDDALTGFSKEIEDVIIKVRSDSVIFPKDTVLNMHQIRAVHKDRIKSNLRCNVRGYIVDDAEISRLNTAYAQPVFKHGMDLLTCLRLRLAMMFAPQEIQSREHIIEQQRQQIESLTKKENPDS